MAQVAADVEGSKVPRAQLPWRVNLFLVVLRSPDRLVLLHFHHRRVGAQVRLLLWIGKDPKVYSANPLCCNDMRTFRTSSLV